MSEPARVDDSAAVLRTDKAWRLRRLLDLLSEDGRLSVTQAAAALDVSEATIRRDFTALARQQLVARTHGGVVATSVAYELPVRYRGTGDGAKERIAAAAAALVTAGQVIGFNGGTTTSTTARELAGRQDLAELPARPALTIVTNALNIAGELVLRPHIRTVSVGGVARPQSYEVVGPLAHQVLGELWLDHLILGVDGIDVAGGATCYHEGEASINASMVEHAQEVTVVATPEKLGHRTFARICEIASIHRLITTKSAAADRVAVLRDAGVDVVLV